MKYELYLRLPEGAKRLPSEAIRQSLGRHDFSMDESGNGRLDLGQGLLQADGYVKRDWDAGTPAEPGPAAELDGINFSFPMGIPAAEGERAITCILAIKDDLEVDLFDPQLGELVSRIDHQRIVETWGLSHDFQFGVVGTPGLGSGPDISSAPRGIPVRFKLIFLVAVVILVGIFVFRSCFKRWMDSSMNPPHPDDDEDIIEYQGP